MIGKLFQKLDPSLLSDSEWRRYQWSIGLPMIAICVSAFFLTPKIARRALVSAGGEIHWLTLFDISLMLIGVAACMAFLIKVALQHIELAQQQRRFISSVSHELRTPLTTLRMYGEMLAAGRFQSEEKRAQCFNYLRIETERLHRLVENVLAISLANDKGKSLQLEMHTVRHLLDQTSNSLEGLVELSPFELTMHIEDSLHDKHVLISSDAFTQIMVNLVDNSLKYATIAERKEIVITALSSETKEYLLFSVRDYGPGFLAEDEKEILKPFSRGSAKTIIKQPGTGLGLALVSRLTDMMGGSLEVSNEEPGFCTTLRFPLSPASS